MRSVLEGKVYDTEKAESIAHYEYSHSGDFNHVYEELYVTNKGNFFFEYSGGGMSKYRESCGNNSWSGSSGLRLPNDGGNEYEPESGTGNEAYDFICEHGSVEVALKYFPNEIGEA